MLSASRTQNPKRLALLNKLGGLVLGGLTLGLALLHPPFWNWQPIGGRTTIVVAALTLLYLFGPGRLRIGSLIGLWLILAACLLTPPGELGTAQEAILAPRLLLLLVALFGWIWVIALNPWVKQGLLALLVPPIVLCIFVWAVGSKTSNDFQPYQVAVDGQGRLLVTDYDAAMIRVFSPDGNLTDKLRTNDNLISGVTGFLPAGPSELGQLGQNATPPSTEFKSCGLATDRQGYFYLLAKRPRQLLRLDSTSGQVVNRWNLPPDYVPAVGCLAVDQRYIYLGDQTGTGRVQALNPQNGEVVTKWILPNFPTDLTSDGNGAVYALIRGKKVCRIQIEKEGSPACWALPEPRNLGFEPYGGLAATRDEIFVGDVSTSQVWIFTPAGKFRGTLGGPGRSPGQLFIPLGLALDGSGNLVVSDAGHRIVQRYSLANRQLNGQWRAIEDEKESGKQLQPNQEREFGDGEFG